MDRRAKYYGANAIFHRKESVGDCARIEKEIISRFKKDFEIIEGKETFKGNLESMLKIFDEVVGQIPKTEISLGGTKKPLLRPKKEHWEYDKDEWEAFRKSREGSYHGKAVIWDVAHQIGRYSVFRQKISAGKERFITKKEKGITGPLKTPSMGNYDYPEDYSYPVCHSCDIASKTSDFVEHLSSSNHAKAIQKDMECSSCGYRTNNDNEFRLHLGTERHELSTYFIEKFNEYLCISDLETSLVIAEIRLRMKYGILCHKISEIPQGEKDQTNIEYIERLDCWKCEEETDKLVYARISS